jgi:hypothetical protein
VSNLKGPLLSRDRSHVAASSATSTPHGAPGSAAAVFVLRPGFTLEYANNAILANHPSRKARQRATASPRHRLPSLNSCRHLEAVCQMISSRARQSRPAAHFC